MPGKHASVLSVGNCDPDHGMISEMLHRHFDVTVDRVMFVDDALERMNSRRYGLVMFNRLIFADASDGMELLRRARAEASLADVPIMMISNYPEAQEKCVAGGGVPGFGKAAIGDEKTIAALARYLPRK